MQEEKNHSTQAGEADVLYHYCSTEAFRSIIESGNIRLSALDFSNDALEGELLWQRIAQGLRQRGVPGDAIQSMEKEAARTLYFWVGYGFCLSTKGDNLGQWRGYADDGHGFSIGFSKSALEALIEKNPFPINGQQGKAALERVRYVEDADDAIEATLVAIARLHGDAPALGNLLAHISRQRYLYKPSGFTEEHEWRILVAPRAQDLHQLHFRATRSRLVPFLELPFSQADPIVSITAGPKQLTPDAVIQGFLKKHGVASAAVRRSACSYR
ncbi:DUF2971 domain-containing protein [Acidovorax sp. NCPPB 2350]|nr:DUF2971 domain-containing protein [Acidovorax sp. NCPPB 2350]